jgi:hypothetical protein
MSRIDNKPQSVLPRCFVCNTPLGEASHSLFVEGGWVHHSCAFGKAVAKNNLKEKQRNL